MDCEWFPWFSISTDLATWGLGTWNCGKWRVLLEHLSRVWTSNWCDCDLYLSCRWYMLYSFLKAKRTGSFWDDSMIRLDDLTMSFWICFQLAMCEAVPQRRAEARAGIPNKSQGSQKGRVTGCADRVKAKACIWLWWDQTRASRMRQGWLEDKIGACVATLGNLEPWPYVCKGLLVCVCMPAIQCERLCLVLSHTIDHCMEVLL